MKVRLRNEKPSKPSTKIRIAQAKAASELNEEFVGAFNVESNVRAEGLTDKKIADYAWDKIDLPNLYAAPLDDFSLTALIEGELVKARWVRYDFKPETINRIRTILQKPKVVPVCVVYQEAHGFKAASALCHDPQEKDKTALAISPLIYGTRTERSDKLWDYMYHALCIVQNEILHRRKCVHRLQAAPMPEGKESVKTSTAPKSGHISKHSTIIRLNKNVVNIYTTNPERHHWTDWWVVGTHFRTTERKMPDGTIQKHVAKIDAYLKGPQRNSEEAKAYFEAYLKTKESKEVNIEIR